MSRDNLEKIWAVDETGKEKEFTVVTSFEMEETGKKYAVCFRDVNMDKEPVELVVFAIEEESLAFTLVEKEEEIKEVERVLEELQKIGEKEMAKNDESN